MRCERKMSEKGIIDHNVIKRTIMQQRKTRTKVGITFLHWDKLNMWKRMVTLSRLTSSTMGEVMESKK